MLREVETLSFRSLAEDVLGNVDAQINGPLPCRNCSGGSEATHSSHLADIRTRFLLWAGNLGAGHRDQDSRSLHKRLEDAPEVAGHIRGILVEIRDLLIQGTLF